MQNQMQTDMDGSIHAGLQSNPTKTAMLIRGTPKMVHLILGTSHVIGRLQEKHCTAKLLSLRFESQTLHPKP